MPSLPSTVSGAPSMELLSWQEARHRMAFDPAQLPADLPVPADDGAAAHLTGAAMPPITLPATSGEPVRVDTVPGGFGRLVIYAYPMTGLPGVPVPDGWDDIPGARGCTPESCGFRDHAAELAALGAGLRGRRAPDAAAAAHAHGQPPRD